MLSQRGHWVILPVVEEMWKEFSLRDDWAARHLGQQWDHHAHWHQRHGKLFYMMPT